MKKTNLLLVSLVLISSISAPAFADTSACNDFYSMKMRAAFAPQVETSEMRQAKAYFSGMVPINLIQYRPQEINHVASGRKLFGHPKYLIANAAIDALTARLGTNSRWGTQEIVAELNEQTLNLLAHFEPNDSSDRRLDAVTKEMGLSVLQSIPRHPVVGDGAAARYDQPGTHIGFCFGRGCYADMAFMRLGVDRDSIKKLWAVGTMGTSSSILWDFHIGYTVRGTDGNWYVVDNVPGSYRILDYRSWAEHFKAQNKGKDLRIYITDGDKFTASLGAYDPVQMGTNVPASQDWYKGYFQDLIRWFKETSDEDFVNFLKISEMPERPVPVNQTPEQKRISDAEELAFSQLPPHSLPLPNDGATVPVPGQGGWGKTLWGKFKKIWR